MKLFLSSFSKKKISVCQDLITKYFIPKKKKILYPQVYMSSCNREVNTILSLMILSITFPKDKIISLFMMGLRDSVPVPRTQHLQVVELSLEFTSPESSMPPCKQTLSSPGSPYLLHMYHDSIFWLILVNDFPHISSELMITVPVH